MAKLNDTGYRELAKVLHEKGYKASEIFPILEEKNFTIKFQDKIYQNIYASKIMAYMYELEIEDYLDLDE